MSSGRKWLNLLLCTSGSEINGAAAASRLYKRRVNKLIRPKGAKINVIRVSQFNLYIKEKPLSSSSSVLLLSHFTFHVGSETELQMANSPSNRFNCTNSVAAIPQIYHSKAISYQHLELTLHRWAHCLLWGVGLQVYQSTQVLSVCLSSHGSLCIALYII